jgi:hypothetical protein
MGSPSSTSTDVTAWVKNRHPPTGVAGPTAYGIPPPGCQQLTPLGFVPTGIVATT